MQVEWLLPDRHIAIPDELSLHKAAERIVGRTGPHPHMQLTFSTDARERFDSFATAFNIESARLRRGSNADAAAEEGLSCLTLFEYRLSWSIVGYRPTL